MNKPCYDLNKPHIMTFTGKKFYYLDVKPDDICIEDIAHALSNTCRYNGHCKNFYSVAEHSILCCDRGSNWLCKIWGLLHDAAEAYIGDLVSPFKHRLLFQYSDCNCKVCDYEDYIIRAIAKKFGIPYPIPEEVHKTDRVLLNMEMEFLWGDKPRMVMLPEDAERIFLYYFRDLMNKRLSDDCE